MPALHALRFAAPKATSWHRLASVLVDRPLKAMILVGLALVGVKLAHRAIERFVNGLQPQQAREALEVLREGSLPDDTTPLRLRRAQRTETVGALLKSVAAL